MEEKLQNLAYRAQLIAEIKGQENLERVKKSKEEWDLFTGNIRPYVKRDLECRHGIETANETPIVSSVNIIRKEVESKASLYKNEPERSFSDLSNEQKEVVELVYDDMKTDFNMLQSNKLYELQKHQTHLLVEPKKGKLTIRPIKAHQVNVVPNELDPEDGDVYIFSGFDRISANVPQATGQDGMNQKIGDYDDSIALNERYVVWAKSFHFVMDGKGQILSEEVDNPIGMLPVIEASAMKDFTYWREVSNDSADFTVFFNSVMSMIAETNEMQSFAQAVVKGPEDLLMQRLDMGPKKVLKLVTNPNMDEDVDFKFENPSPDIAGSLNFAETLLSMYLSSQGVDVNAVSGKAQADKFNSGIERLLAQIEKFEASKEVMSLYRDVENRLYEIVKAWLDILNGTDQLDSKYYVSIPESSEVTVKYQEPQSLLSEEEKLNIVERRLDLGLWDLAEAKAWLDEISKEQAEEDLEEIEQDEEQEFSTAPVIEDSIVIDE